MVSLEDQTLITLSEPEISGTLVCHNVPERAGVYIVTDSQGTVFYVGSTNCLRRRIAYLEAHVFDSSSGGFTHEASDPLIHFQAEGYDVYVHYIVCDDYKSREQQLKAKYNPPWNRR